MNRMNKIEIVQVNDNSYELEMSTFKQMLYQIHLLKPKGPINIFPELKENISSSAEIIEPTDEPVKKRMRLDDK